MRRPLLLALDIGNVCIKIDHLNFAKALGLPELPEFFRRSAFSYECGQTNETGFFDTLVSAFQGKYQRGQIIEAFDSILIKAIPGMEELVSSFPAEDIKAVFFSDISATHLRRTRKLFRAAKFVPEGVYSFECGNLKPSGEMFSSFETRFGKPDLYVDDRLELIEAARERNWHAMQFTGAGELRDELKKLSKTD